MASGLLRCPTLGPDQQPSGPLAKSGACLVPCRRISKKSFSANRAPLQQTHADCTSGARRVCEYLRKELWLLHQVTAMQEKESPSQPILGISDRERMVRSMAPMALIFIPVTGKRFLFVTFEFGSEPESCQRFALQFGKGLQWMSHARRLHKSLADSPEKNIISHCGCHRTNTISHHEERRAFTPTLFEALLFLCSVLHR